MIRFILPLFFVLPLIADEMALSVDEAFPNPYATYDDCNYDDDYIEPYDADVDETWYWDDEIEYPGRAEDELMDNLKNPW